MRAAVYARLSKAPEVEGNVDQQLREGRALAERHGWDVVDEYRDEGLSAWRKNARRPEFERLLADAESGRVDVIVTRKLNRLTRNARDWGRLRSTDVKYVEWAGGGDVMPTLVADIMASMAEAESEEISSRVKLSEERRVEGGELAKPPRGGRRPYGYGPGHEVIESEAEVIREVARRYLGGETVQAIADDLNARGVPTAGGGTWGITTLRRLLASPRLAGIRVHRGVEHSMRSSHAIVTLRRLIRLAWTNYRWDTRPARRP